jgi:arylsulfatase A-like enzyme
MAGPGIAAGQTSDALVELVDLAPTLLAAAGLAPHPGMQGRSLWPLLSSETHHHRQDIYCEYYNAMPWHRQPQAQATMLRTRQHKLVVAHGLETGELYDLAADPTETVNRWDDPAAAPVKMELLLRLTDRMAWTVDPLPPRMAPW